MRKFCGLFRQEAVNIFYRWRSSIVQRTLRDEYDKLENLLRIKGIDPDEFLSQNKNDNGGDDEGDENMSDCSECSCESCCGEDCCDEKPEDNSGADKTDENSKGEASTSKGTTSQTTTANGSKNTPDEHNKRSGKDRLNVNQSESIVNHRRKISFRFS